MTGQGPSRPDLDLCREVAERLGETRKYRHLCDDTLLRISCWALARHASPQAALKAAKRKLHQVFGAYAGGVDFESATVLVDQIANAKSDAEVREACGEVLASHVSTAERIPVMEHLFRDVFGKIGTPGSLVDVACGLNPFALPWMGLPRGTRYDAWDIDRRVVSLTSRFLRSSGQAGGATCRDVLAEDTEIRAEALLLLKAVPCLEQQQKGAVVGLLREACVDHAVISFPLRSLGGAERGMRAHYGQVAGGIADAVGAPVRELLYPDEAVYILTLSSRPRPPRVGQSRQSGDPVG